MPKCISGADDKKKKAKELDKNVKQLTREGKKRKKTKGVPEIEDKGNGASLLQPKKDEAINAYISLKEYCQEIGIVLAVEEKIAKLENDNSELDKEVVRLTQESKLKNDEFSKLDSAYRELNQIKESLSKENKSKTREILDKEEVILQKEAEIKSLRIELDAKKQELRKKEETISERDLEIQRLTDSNNDQVEKYNILTDNLAAAEENTKRLVEDITRKNQQIADEEDKNARLQAKFQKLQLESRKLQEELALENARLHQAVENLKADFNELKRKTTEESARLRNTIDHLQNNVVAERKAKEDALTRLSAAAASKLRDKNPGITDLSDPNRPLKLSEKISELYDNEWTNAMEKLEDEGLDEDGGVDVLLKIFTTLFTKCKDLGQKHLENIHKMIVVPNLEWEDENGNGMKKIPELPTEIMKPIKDFRKAHAEKAVERLQKKTTFFLKELEQIGKVQQACSEYIASCIEISWLMCVQDPPVHMRWDFQPNDDFDTNTMRSYTKSGKFVSYVVWPVLYLHEGGPLLAKGVVQGRKTKVEAAKAEKEEQKSAENDAKHGDNSSEGNTESDASFPNSVDEINKTNGTDEKAAENKDSKSSNDTGLHGNEGENRDSHDHETEERYGVPEVGDNCQPTNPAESTAMNIDDGGDDGEEEEEEEEEEEQEEEEEEDNDDDDDDDDGEKADLQDSGESHRSEEFHDASEDISHPADNQAKQGDGNDATDGEHVTDLECLD